MSNPTVAPCAQQSTSQPVETQLSAVLDKTAEQTAMRLEANKTLEACVAAFSAGESAMRSGRLEAGRLADLYVKQRVALGDARDMAVKALAGELAKYASSAADTDVNGLIRVYHTWRLLAVESGRADANVPYGHYVNAFVQLVERTAKDGAETWVLLPGLESECKALFLDCTVNSFSRDVCKDKVRELHTTYALRQAELRDKLAKEAAHKAEIERQSAEQASAAAKDAAEQERKAKEALRKAKEEEKQALTEALNKANAEKLAKQQAAAALNAAANAAEREKKLAEQASKLAAKQADKLANPENKPERKKPEEAEPQQHGKPPVHNPIVAAKEATAKDLAESLRDQICANRKQSDVLRELARCFDWRPSDAKAFGAGLASNPGKHALEFAFALAEYLCDNLPAQESKPVAKVA
jgi:hypothetical protein